MSKQVIEQNEALSFFAKYKKRLLTALGISLIPSIIFMCSIVGISIYLFVDNISNSGPYSSYIEKGYRAGFNDGISERGSSDTNVEYLSNTPWDKYKEETDMLKKQAIEEKEKYLAQFPESTRGAKRAEMSANNFKLPLELQLKKRFTIGNDFYADHVKKIVIRGTYHTEEEYQKGLRDEAWKLGHEYGYARGWWNDDPRYGLDSLNKR